MHTFELVVVSIIDVLLRSSAAAQEALLVIGLHVCEELVVAIESLAAEAAGRVAPKPCLCHRPRGVATPRVHLKIRSGVRHLL